MCDNNSVNGVYYVVSINFSVVQYQHPRTYLDPITSVIGAKLIAHVQMIVRGVASKMSTDGSKTGSFIVRGATEDDLN